MKTVLVSCLLMVAASSIANATKVITCDDIVFAVPKKLGNLPSIDFEYPSHANIFSFANKNLLLVAHDQDEKSRVRIVISAQLNKATGSYAGQIIRDYGGNEIQLSNGPVSCSVK
jgi:hypothetical protein